VIVIRRTLIEEQVNRLLSDSAGRWYYIVGRRCIRIAIYHWYTVLLELPNDEVANGPSDALAGDMIRVPVHAGPEPCRPDIIRKLVKLRCFTGEEIGQHTASSSTVGTVA
jgi:hypothetical protein